MEHKQATINQLKKIIDQIKKGTCQEILLIAKNSDEISWYYTGFGEQEIIWMTEYIKIETINKLLEKKIDK